LGAEVVDSRIVSDISKIKQDLQTNIGGLNIAKADIISADRLNTTTSEGWIAYFNLSSDIGLQITKLNLLLQNKFPKPEDRKKLNYIDLRFENKVYYK